MEWRVRARNERKLLHCFAKGDSDILIRDKALLLYPLHCIRPTLCESYITQRKRKSAMNQKDSTYL